jgi:hypothetical protein
MATFAILVRFDIPDDDVRDGGFDQAAVPLMDALRTLSPVKPTNVCAYAEETAEMVLRHGGMGTP